MAAVNVSKVTANLMRSFSVCLRAAAYPSHTRVPFANYNGNVSTAISLQVGHPGFRQPLAQLSTAATPKKKPKTVNITFIDRDGDEQIVHAKVGDTLLEVAKEFDIDLEGACEGTLSCSTCHLIVDPEWFDKIPDPLTEEEQDMLDMAYGLTDTSRLGCQILVSEKLEGIKLTVPSATRDVRNF